MEIVNYETFVEVYGSEETDTIENNGVFATVYGFGGDDVIRNYATHYAQWH